MNTNLSKLVGFCSIVALLGAGCAGSTSTTPSANTATKQTVIIDNKPVGTKPTDVATTPTTPTTAPDTTMSSDRVVDPKELPVIDSSWKTYSNSAVSVSFQYPTKGRYAPEYQVELLQPLDARLSGGCMNPQSERRTPDGTLIVGDSTFCVVREGDAGAGQRFYTDSYTVPRGERIVLITFTKRLANGDMFEDVACHGKVVISSGTSCIPFDEALYRAHLNQIISTYRHE